jgi:hypothetical protein
MVCELQEQRPSAGLNRFNLYRQAQHSTRGSPSWLAIHAPAAFNAPDRHCPFVHTCIRIVQLDGRATILVIGRTNALGNLGVALGAPARESRRSQESGVRSQESGVRTGYVETLRSIGNLAGSACRIRASHFSIAHHHPTQIACRQGGRSPSGMLTAKSRWTAGFTPLTKTSGASVLVRYRSAV